MRVLGRNLAEHGKALCYNQLGVVLSIAKHGETKANKGGFLENPHTFRTLKSPPLRDGEADIRNAFLTALVLFASDAVQALWERRTEAPETHSAHCEAWCRDFRLTNGGKETPKWLLDHAAMALHLWHRGEGFADLLGWWGFDLLGYHTVEPDPGAGWPGGETAWRLRLKARLKAKWRSEPRRRGRPRLPQKWPLVRKDRGRPGDMLLACQLTILNQIRGVRVADITEVLSGRVDPNEVKTFGPAVWPPFGTWEDVSGWPFEEPGWHPVRPRPIPTPKMTQDPDDDENTEGRTGQEAVASAIKRVKSATGLRNPGYFAAEPK